MKRALSAFAATVVGVVWLVTFKVAPVQVDAVTSTAQPTRDPSSAATTTPTRTATPAPSTAAGTPAPNGTFTGGVVRTVYGDVQVRISISGQKLTDVQALTLPTDRARSAAISQYSAPILRGEAIQAQSARIDIISGATYTSIAYSRSLQSALQQAHLG